MPRKEQQEKAGMASQRRCCLNWVLKGKQEFARQNIEKRAVDRRMV